MDKILEKTLNFEGGYVNNPNDRGGATNFGITEKVARRHGYKGDMRDLPKSKAVEIFKESFVDPKLNLINDETIRLLIFDASVNHGRRWGVRFVQRACNTINKDTISEDGILGRNTIKAIEKAGYEQVAFWSIVIRGQYFRDIVKNDSNQKTFIKGWGNRIKALMNEVV